MEKRTKIKIAKIILLTIAAAGVLSMAVLAPNALQSLEMFYGNKKKGFHQYYINNVINRLKNKGFIEFRKKNGKTFIYLTEKGRQNLLKYQLQELTIKKPKKWDKKWRILIFDIKEYKRQLRDSLRKELVNLGFLRLQDSVWVYPYECEEIVIMLKSYFHFGKEVLYITAEKIENDEWLKKEFNLI